MFYSIRDFFGRHKKKIIGTGIFIGGVVILSKFVRWKLRKWQEKETKEFLERTQRQYHFESMERTSNQTVLSLFSTLCDTINKNVDTASSVNILEHSPSDKIAVWNSLKTQCFTRVVVLAYAGAMLVVTLRIQINLIGGYMCQNVIMGEAADTICVTSELQQTYLNLCRHFMNTGIMELCKMLEGKVKIVLENVPLSRKLMLQDTEQLFWAIHSLVTSDDNVNPARHLAKYMLPPQEEFFRTCHLKPDQIELLDKMFTETLDLLESEEVMSVVSSCVTQGFSGIINYISKFYNIYGNTKVVGNVSHQASNNLEPVAGPSWIADSVSLVSNIAKNNTLNGGNMSSVETKPLAKLLPVINNMVQNNVGEDPLSLWIKPHIENEKLMLLAANIYEAFSYKT